jgi:hypothetical protein
MDLDQPEVDPEPLEVDLGLLGEPVTAKSLMLLSFLLESTSARNSAPVPVR